MVAVAVYLAGGKPSCGAENRTVRFRLGERRLENIVGSKVCLGYSF